MWRESILQWERSAKFAQPTSMTALAEAEAALGSTFPEDLRSLLLESNGVSGEYGLGLVWDVARIVKDNKFFRAQADFRRLYMSFESLFFFADAGNGDQFAFRVLAGQVKKSGVYAWNHENDSRIWVASSLKQYLEWWLSGKIKL